MTSEEYLRTRFLERLAHDTRGAAGVSMGALQQIEVELAGRDDLQPLLGIARRGIRRVLRISDSLAAAAELESKSAPLALARVDLGGLAAQAAERAHELDHRDGVAFESHCESIVASVDGQRMTQAIFELTSNAMRAARRSVTVQTFATDDAITVAVLDDGPGCKPFAPRFTPSAEHRGLGLGLALAADIAALHGGELVVGRSGERTSVKIVLPRI